MFLLTGLSVKLAPILKFIPMPVLYGVLMFMGVNTLRGMQFIDRCLLFFMPSKHQPDTMYLRHVPLKKVIIFTDAVDINYLKYLFQYLNLFQVHLFTAIQIATLGALWIIKSTPASLVFPLMVRVTILASTHKCKTVIRC